MKNRNAEKKHDKTKHAYLLGNLLAGTDDLLGVSVHVLGLEHVLWKRLKYGEGFH